MRGEDRAKHEGRKQGRCPARLDAENQHEPASQFGRKGDISKPAGKVDRAEEGSRAGKAEDHQFQHYAVGEKHDAKADAQKRRGDVCGTILIEHGGNFQCKCIYIAAAAQGCQA